jgi:hypothetical protein
MRPSLRYLAFLVLIFTGHISLAQYWQDVGTTTGIGYVTYVDAHNNLYTRCDPDRP